MDSLPLMLGSGIFWMLTYIFIIRRGFLDNTYGMPFVALCANISWEFIFAFLHPHSGVQRPVNITWFFLDVIILFQFLKYGRREFSKLSLGMFYLMFGITLVTSFCAVLFITYEFADWSGAYAAFGQNLLMSILFVNMIYQRKSLYGQSALIALTKMIGTVCASLAFFLYVTTFKGSVLLYFFYLAIFVYDLLYFLLCIRSKR